MYDSIPFTHVPGVVPEMKARNELGMTLHEEQIFCEGLHDVLTRLIKSNDLVLELAKKELGEDMSLNDLIVRARRYVLTCMTSTVGVRKIAKEKWGMVLTKAPK